MSIVNHKEGKKVSPGGKLSSQDPLSLSDRARIEHLESKIAHLEVIVSSLKFQTLFIADILRKERS